MNKRIQALAVWACAMLSGCTTPVYEQQYAWSEGWRKGKVMEVSQAATLVEQFTKDCKASAFTTKPGDQYATISYRRLGRSARVTVALDKTIALKVGDEIYVNVRDCLTKTKA